MADWLTEAARRPISTSSQELPEGLEIFDERPHFTCRVCGNLTPWDGELEDYDDNALENVCGSSPRCCP